MSTFADRIRDPRVLVPAVLAVVVLLVLLVGRRDKPEDAGSGPSPAASSSPEAEHAAWDIRVAPAGAAGRVTDRHRRTVRSQEQDVAAAVVAVNDALLLGENEIADLQGAAVTRDAARALDESPLKLDEDAAEILARRRNARIGVDVHGARRAVATAVVVARVTAEDRQVRMRYETTMWLERVRTGWRVFAFDGRRRRA